MAGYIAVPVFHCLLAWRFPPFSAPRKKEKDRLTVSFFSHFSVILQSLSSLFVLRVVERCNNLNKSAMTDVTKTFAPQPTTNMKQNKRQQKGKREQKRKRQTKLLRNVNLKTTKDKEKDNQLEFHLDGSLG